MRGLKLMKDFESRDGSARNWEQRDPLGRRQFLRGVAATGALAGAGGILSACSSGGAGSPGASSSPSANGPPRRGGNLKVGLTGGSGTDTLDPHKGLTYLGTAPAQAPCPPPPPFNNKAQTAVVVHRGDS